jgi:hypothetical protein
VKVELAKHGLDSAPDTREELAQYMERESQKWGKVLSRPTAQSENDPGKNHSSTAVMIT